MNPHYVINGEQMKNKAKLILASSVFVAALMLLVPLAQIDMSGGGGTGNSNSDSIVLSDATNSNLTSVSDGASLKSNLEDGKSVQLSKDIVLNLSGDNPFISIKSNNNETTILDLNGKTLTINTINDKNSNRLVVAEGATVTIKNGTIVYKGDDGSAAGKSPIRVGSMKAANSTPSALESNLTLDRVNITSAEYGVVVFGKANLTVNDSNITAVSSAVSTNGNTANVGSNSCGSKITITEGQYTSTNAAAIYFPGGDTLTVTGGTFTGKTGFDIRSGTVTIDDATINVFGIPSESKLNAEGKMEDGPTSWGMGIAVFNMGSYGQDVKGDYTELNIKIANTPINNAVYNVYVGDYYIDTNGTLKTSDLGNHTYSQIHTVKLNDDPKTDIVLVDGTRSADSEVPLTIDINNRIFANGNAITISKGSDPTQTTNSKITYGNNITFIDNFDLSKFTIFGGSKNAPVDSTSITMNDGMVAYIYGGGYGTSESTKADVTGTANISIAGGKLSTIYGGGLLYSTVANSNISMTGGTTTFIMGGGACSVKGMPSPGTIDNPYTTISGTASINVSGGTAIYVMGGGQGYSQVNNAEITISGNANITELIAGGSNGSTKPTASININGGTIGMVFSVNRGSLENPTIIVTDGNINNLYVGASQNSDDTTGVVTGTATLKVTGGAIANMYLGTGLDDASIDLTLRDGDKIIAAGGHEFSEGEEFTEYNGSTTHTLVKAYTIASDKTWTIKGGMLDLSDATLTNNGKLIFDDLSVGENGLVIKNIKGTGDLKVKNTNFTTKGLILDAVENNIFITGCNFNSISGEQRTYSEKYPGYYVNAILINKCTGNVTIGGDDVADKNTMSGVSKEDSKSNPGRGIYVESSGADGKSLIIKNNYISDIAYNAIQIINLKYSEIIVSNNVIDNWDSDKDCVSEAQFESGKVLQAGGRAIRLSLSANIDSNISIENNTFVMNYSSNTFSSNIGEQDGIGYDNGNILKANADIEFKNNILALSGIDSYSYADLFIIGSDENKNIVTFDPNGGYYYTSSEPGILCSIITAGSTVSEPTTPSRSGSYSFDGWYDAVTGGEKQTFPLSITADTTLYAKWTYTGGSGIPVTPPTDDPEPEPIVPDENNNVTVPSIDDKKADELVHEAVSSGSDSISIIDTNNVEGEYTEVTVSKSDLETISKKIENNNNINSVSIETSEGDIIIEKEVLNSILETTDADSVSFEIEDAKDKLTEEQKEAVGDRPVYDINIKAGNENITSFNGKTITISLPYTLKAGEDPENIVVYYVKEDGSLEKVNCTYKDGKVIFETDHLSKYVIGYEESDKPVTPDTPDNKKDDNNTIYYAVAAVIVILIIIALAYYFMKKKQ